jgi:hypothetical protein
MDKSAKHHYSILIISLSLCIFLYVDAYLLPLRHSTETVKRQNVYRSTGRRGNLDRRTYTISTNVRDYDIPGAVFAVLNTDMNIGLDKSYITGAIQKLSMDNDEATYVYAVGFMRTGFGKFFAPAVLLGGVAMLVFFKSHDNLQGRANLTYAVFICSLFLLFAHLDLHLF